MSVGVEKKKEYKEFLDLMRAESVKQFANGNVIFGWLLSNLPPQVYRRLLNVNPVQPSFVKRLSFVLPRKLILFPAVWLGYLFLRIRERDRWAGTILNKKDLPSGVVVWMEYRSLMKQLSDEPLMAELRGHDLSVIEFPKCNFPKPSIGWTLFRLPLELDESISHVQQFLVEQSLPPFLNIDTSFVMEKVVIAPKLLSLLIFAILVEPFVRGLGVADCRATLITRSGGGPIGSLIRGIRQNRQGCLLTHMHMPHSSNVGDMHFSDADYFSDILCARNMLQQKAFKSLRGPSDHATPMVGNPEGFYLLEQRKRNNPRYIYVLVGGAYLSDRSKRELEWLWAVVNICEAILPTIVKAKNADRKFAMVRLVRKLGLRKGLALCRHSEGVALARLVQDAAVGIVVVNDKNYVSNVFQDLVYFGIPSLVYTEDDPADLVNKTEDILARCVDRETLEPAVGKIIRETNQPRNGDRGAPKALEMHGELSPGQRLAAIIQAREDLARAKTSGDSSERPFV